MDQQEPKTHVLVCYHCGNKTQMNRIAHHQKEWLENFLGFNVKPYQVKFFTEWDLFLCPVCESETLLKTQKNTDHRDSQSGSMIRDEQIVYPPVTFDKSGIPENVKKSFEAALRIKNTEGTLCAIGIRRTLEIMCKDKQANGDSLYEKLKDLSDNGVLPPILNEMTTVLRKLGNEAAHGDEREFSSELVDSMVKFTHVILDYVYVLPDKLGEIQDKLRKTIEGTASLHGSATVQATANEIKREDA
ncbi:DUF4145 domain-containing protein [Brevibacillus fortis]|uniref:DUF4145 domain-containing protein n=1 Tax=Brevibacillus fortis TaxID=2126352 RepID=UPI0038FC4B1E